MKRYIYLLCMFFAGTALFTSCDEKDLNPESIFDEVVLPEKNEFDVWLENNYLYPYNVDFKYRMEDIESSFDNNLVPIEYDLAVQMARIVKHVWFEAYDEVAGIDFTRQYAPKIIHLIGSRQWNPGGTITLGYAEGGLKVTLVGGNWLDPTNVPLMNEYYFKTMHHEFAHILHQTIDYPTEYNTLSEGHYSPSGWNNRTDINEYAPLGFITAYAGSEGSEDIAEVTACYLVWTEADWLAVEEAAGSEGWAIIQEKINIMKDYMLDNYNIDMDQLHDVITRRCNELSQMDLTTLP